MANIVLATSLLWPEPDSETLLREALVDAGHSCVSVPWNGEDQSPFRAADLVLLRSCWDYFKAPQKFLDWLDRLSAMQTAVRNDLSLVRWNFDKSYLIELRDAGFNVPQTICLDPTDHAMIHSIMTKRGWDKAVRKPISGQSSQFVDVLSLTDPGAWPKSAMPTKRALLQAFEQDVELRGETLLYFFRGTFSYAIQRLPSSKTTRDRIEVSVPEEVIDQAQKILSYVAPTPLYARIDGLIRDNDFKLMELELIEPSFAFETAPARTREFVDAVEKELSDIAERGTPCQAQAGR